MKFLSKKYFLPGGILFCLFFTAVWLVVFNADYRLNRVVRLVGMRISQFERLSFIRNEPYRIVFNREEYSVWNLTREGDWELFVKHPLPEDIQTNMDSFELYVSRGSVSSMKVKSRQRAKQSIVILEFRLVDEESKKRGLIISGNGKWRVI